MNLPLPGHEKKVSDSVAEAEGDSFMALMAQHTANVGSG